MPNTMISFVTANLNYARPAKGQQADIDYLVQHYDVLLVEEIVKGVRTPQGFVRIGDPDAEEAIFVRHAVPIVNSGVKRSALSKFGEKIGWRTFPWALLDLPGEAKPVLAVCTHMPPQRMSRLLYEAYAFRLRRLIRRRARSRGREWLAGGDWNERLWTDPAKLSARFKARWFGPRIDGFAVSPRLAERSADTASDYSRIRADNHPFVPFVVLPRRAK